MERQTIEIIINKSVLNPPLESISDESLKQPLAMKYLAQFRYLGTNYIGWQIQPGVEKVSVQSCVETALAKTYKVSSHVSSRTDAGTHALMVVFMLHIRFLNSNSNGPLLTWNWTQIRRSKSTRSTFVVGRQL